MAFKGGIILLILIVFAVGAVTGLRYYKFIQEDPAYCSVCHIMEEGYKTWEKSDHYLIICQKCHRLSVIEGDRLLLSRYIRGAANVKQEHGNTAPWEACLKCHMEETTQGSVTFRKSYGHARHIFMQNLKCSNCHSGEKHELKVSHTKCQGCHADKMVHGMGTAGTYCLNCHSFKEASSLLVSEERCYNCHRDIPTKGVMSQIKCYECHVPHEKLKLESKDCLGSCHGNETRVGQHGLHMTKTSLECLDCHKPHKWTVGKEDAKGLCNRCHPVKNPQSFIY